MLAMGGSLLLWLAYNLLIARQREFQMSNCAFGFVAGLFFVGIKWVMEGWETVGPMVRPQRKRKKKKKKRPLREEE